ncbi:glycoside hydrolase family 95 protein [Paenibacillus sp. IB182496]|uniref:Glycoside hydrolase family 95 protein n=1 Tax=Paenibacillus sabuli TaxID=2772509 RepID=A0A927BWP0_9BACL|nr:glycoside hydrolase family 95 protein [Paenibacillus sabuli]MBD2847015.1 glycoside hydrolase family 95 protein [Paenibacillus sabuli]
MKQRQDSENRRGARADASTLWYREPAANWNEALPLGNGRIGAMVYGGAGDETISLNEDTLWSGYPRSSDGAGMHRHYEQAQAQVLAGEYAQAQRLLEQQFGDHLVQMYLPLADLQITMPGHESPADYTRRLTLEDALHTVTWQTARGRYSREMLVSAPSQVAAIRIACSNPGQVSLDARLTGRLRCEQSAAPDGRTVYLEGNCPVCEAPYGQTHSGEAHKIYDADDARKGVGYRAGLRVVAEGGEVRCRDGRLQVRGADTVCLYVAVRTSFNGYDKHPVLAGKPYKDACVRDLDRAEAKGYEAIREAAIADYRHLYDRVELALGADDDRLLPTDERLQRLQRGERDNALFTLLFNYGRYLTIASSRSGTQPANLQGIWNDKLVPPWSSNYTLNINTQMNYWPTLLCGLEECYEPLLRLARELGEAGARTARHYYNAPGFVCHHSTDLWRLTHPGTNRLPGNAQWGFWPMAGGWLCQMMYAYERHTGDAQLLHEIAPTIEQCAAFYRSLLVEKDGQLVFCPSTSPENRHLMTGAGGLGDRESSPLDITTTMTTAIIRDVFTIMAEIAERRGGDGGPYAQLAERLPAYALNPDGSLREWYGAYEDAEPQHRHLSHLYGLFPSGQIRREDAGLRAACRRTLELRGDGGTGWSLAWKINLWAKLGEGTRAYALLRRQLQPVASATEQQDAGGGSYPNLLCAHPPFQIDGNFGACSGILQMLVQIEDDRVYLLPALPPEWSSGRVRGLRLPGGGRLDFAWVDGRVVSSAIHGGKQAYRIV